MGLAIIDITKVCDLSVECVFFTTKTMKMLFLFVLFIAFCGKIGHSYRMILMRCAGSGLLQLDVVLAVLFS